MNPEISTKSGVIRDGSWVRDLIVLLKSFAVGSGVLGIAIPPVSNTLFGVAVVAKKIVLGSPVEISVV